MSMSPILRLIIYNTSPIKISMTKLIQKIQRGNWKPYIEERQDNTLAKRRQTIQWPKEDRQTDNTMAKSKKNKI
jgi:hypothetical protein